MVRLRVRFALKRETGYMSPYSLSDIYCAYNRGVFYNGRNSGWVSPIYMAVTFNPIWYGKKGARWIKIAPWMVRLPSWIALQARRNVRCGF